MSKLKLIFIVLAALLLIYAIGITSQYGKVIKENTRLENNFNEKSSQWIDSEGRLINQISVLESDVKEVKSIFKRKESEIVNNYEKRIYSFKKELATLGIEVNRLRGIIASTVVTIDTVYVNDVTVTDSVITGKYLSTFLDANIKYFTFKQNFSLDYQHRDSIDVLRIVSVKTKSNGNKHWLFPNWRWLWGEDVEYLGYSKNPKSTVLLNIATDIKK